MSRFTLLPLRPVASVERVVVAVVSSALPSPTDFARAASKVTTLAW